MTDTKEEFKIKAFTKSTSKEEIFLIMEDFLTEQGFRIVDKDYTRPWGGYLVIDETQAVSFINTFFPHLSPNDFEGFEKLSPKILIVAPEKRLSWQYHYRRAEIWRLIGGEAAVVLSETDELGTPAKLNLGQVVNLKKEERHRLMGLGNYGIIAEIWEHTDAGNPSDEADIIRISDDFGR